MYEDRPIYWIEVIFECMTLMLVAFFLMCQMSTMRKERNT